MDGGPAGAVAIAQAVAGAAALFDCGSGNLGARFGAAGRRRGAGGAPGPRHTWRAAGARRRGEWWPASASAAAIRRLPGDRAHRPGRVMTGGAPARSASRSSAAARSGACTPRTSRAFPASRCGPSTPGPSTWTRWRRGDCGSPGSRTSPRAVHARTDGSDLPACDFGVVATKALHTRAAVQGAQAALAGAAVVSVQNGLGNEEVIAELVPRVIRGSIVTAGAIVAPGVVRYDAPGDSWFGPFEPRPAPMSEVGAAGPAAHRGRPAHARARGRPGPAVDESRFQLRDQPPGGPDRALGRPRLHRRPASPAGRPADHGGGGGLRAGRDHAHAPAAEAVDEAIAEAYDHKPSMLQDVLARRATEIDVLNGGIAAEGRRVGVPTPRHDCMVALVKGLERSWAA